MRVTALTTLITWIGTVNAALSATGNITLFSDTSCADPVYVNSWIVGRDNCAVADGGSQPYSGQFLSFVLNERPWCVNGSRPYLNIYRDAACTSLLVSFAPGPLYNPTGPDADGTCVAPGADYKALAFICDGLRGAADSGFSPRPSGGQDASSSSLPTSTSDRPALNTQTSRTEPGFSQATETVGTTTPASGTASTTGTAGSSITATASDASSSSTPPASTAGAATPITLGGRMLVAILPAAFLLV
ncbi:hypothetical protein JX265_013103 [Neoarthrinium moseri]|uniref:Uncharacterized protein n=1 Tax=Neoarthrinium moseri TaxID=1658444 RepID=A0A9Q0AJ21_9PEZI|nr:uncharacterized protein JN550_006384 [Neoarthrinium moseri]KAI1852132.1 hypothetical protein JX265_013103 [Neoarthrinium moseri]KAI1868468.1 hypothetical protein JN550_006384 [Neoarthrinium moseri]